MKVSYDSFSRILIISISKFENLCLDSADIPIDSKCFVKSMTDVGRELMYQIENVRENILHQNLQIDETHIIIEKEAYEN